MRANGKPRQHLLCCVPSFPIFNSELALRCKSPGCTKSAESAGCCGYHLHTSFLHRLQSRLKQHYGSTSQASCYFQSLLGDLTSFKDFCELLKFLRIPFKEEEAKAFLNQHRGDKQGKLSITEVLNQCLEGEKSSAYAEPSMTLHPTPPRVTLRSKPHPRPASSSQPIDQSITVSSSAFLSPTSVPFSPLTPSVLGKQDRKTLYFLRDGIELLLRKGKNSVSFSEFELLIETFNPILDVEEVKRLFRRAECKEGGVTRESFGAFWKGSRAEGRGREVKELIKALQLRYESFQEAYGSLAQGSTGVSLATIRTVCLSLGLEPPAALPLAVPALSFQDFKKMWLNSTLSFVQDYCAYVSCVLPVSPPSRLCPSHSKSLQSHASPLWTLVKSRIPSHHLVPALSAIRREQHITPFRLRSILTTYMPKASISTKDLAVLTDYFRERLGNSSGIDIRLKRTSVSISMAGEGDGEVQDCSFYKKERWTPTMAGMAGVPRSVSCARGRRKGWQSDSFQFPYPNKRLTRAKPR